MFFFQQKTAYEMRISDWSSDVCSSDLVGPNLPTMAPNSLYPSADGAWVLIAANSNIIFGRLAHVMQQPELLTDPRFATIRARGERQNMAALDALISDWTRQHDAESLERDRKSTRLNSSH